MSISISSVHFSHLVVSDSLWPHGPQHARPPCPSPTSVVYPNSCPLIELVMPSNPLILCRPLLLQPSLFLNIRVFSNESLLCIRWPKYWSFSFNISPSNEYSGLISFRIDWLKLLEVQGMYVYIELIHSVVQRKLSKYTLIKKNTCKEWKHSTCGNLQRGNTLGGSWEY